MEATIEKLSDYTKGLCVLYVEDDDTVRTETAKLMRILFGTVDVAVNGYEGLDLYKKKVYDIIISDIRMPFLDGTQMAAMIKEINRDQVIVITSAYDDSESLLELINIGVDKFISKPFIGRKFMDVLFQVCKTIANERELAKYRMEEAKFEAMKELTRTITRQAQAVRAEQLASLGELAAGVAHEVNNPINSIINFAQFIMDHVEAGTKLHEYARRIIKEGDRIAGIVCALLSFARDDLNEKETVPVHDIFLDTFALIAAQMEKDGITLLLDLPQDLPPIEANRQHMQQLFLNIINNARYALNQKYGGADPDKILEITGERCRVQEASTVRIVFHDHGTGIGQAIIDKVIDPFFSTKPKGQGTGLGLSISYGIVSDCGGKLLLESEEGVFTKVTVEIPVEYRNASGSTHKETTTRSGCSL